MAFFPDRVEFCGVDICSGPRSQTKRKILNLLRTKRSDGGFVGYSGEELARQVELAGGQGAASGTIRDLRDDIVESLQSQANLECGRHDVILSRGSGYRFADCITVHNGDQPDTGQTMDIDEGGDVPNVRDDDVPNVRNADVPNVRDDAAGTRRAWILQELAEEHRLNARDVADQFKCSVKTAQRDLQALKEEGRIKFVGVPRTGYYCMRKPRKSSQ